MAESQPDFQSPGPSLQARQPADELLDPGYWQEGVAPSIEQHVACETVVDTQSEDFSGGTDAGIPLDSYSPSATRESYDTGPDIDVSEDAFGTGEESSSEVGSSSLPTAGTSTVDFERQTFSFETDHLALRTNAEYKSIMKLLVLLEAQRMQAVQDLSQLEAEKKNALNSPHDFVQRLQDGAVSLPTRQVVPEVPDVDWTKYSIPASYMSATPQSTRAATGTDEDRPSSALSMPTGEEGPSLVASSASSHKAFDVETRIRSQEPTEPLKNRPETHNKPWTIDEQKRLEELLIRFPPEAVEAQRWRKIADALGNRTIKQVASRVQKYFIKLAKAGLEVPGRVPNIPKSSRKVRRVQSTLKTQAFYLSTFFPQHSNPVLMDDAPVAERPVLGDAALLKPAEVVGGSVSSDQVGCGHCHGKLAGLRARCDDCNVELCVDRGCHQRPACVDSGHNVRMVSDSQVDSDYIIDNHYLDPNYLPSAS